MPDTIAGLPLHPLVVHAPVVLLPLSALGLLLLLIIPRARRTFGWLPVLGFALGTVTAWLAKESGQNLNEVIGVSADHIEWGDRLVPISAAAFVVSALWYWRIRSGARGLVTMLLAIAAAILSVLTIVVVVLVGHSGAESAWAGTYAAATDVAPAATEVAPEAKAGDMLTMADVALHAQASDCWTAIDGNVYDMTGWISQHPGGPEVIEALCGVDGTDAFASQHGGEGLPASELESLLVGALQ